jgi:hypothetical protein
MLDSYNLVVVKEVGVVVYTRFARHSLVSLMAAL